MIKDKILVSVSGGRTSWMMAKLLKDKVEPDRINYVFANTGKEREETLIFNKTCAEYFGVNLIWVEAFVNQEYGEGTTHKIVDFNTASRSGEPFEEMIKKYGIPNQSFPHCSRELKAKAIRSYAKSIGLNDYKTAIGIRKDEPSRLNWEKAKKENLFYYLALINVTKSDVAKFWSKMPFDLELKSYEGNCDLCWKKSNRKLLTILVEHPELAEWWNTMEIKYGYFTPESRNEDNPPYTFYRQNTSIYDLIVDTKTPFDKAIDESKYFDKWKQLLMWDDELDTSSGCIRSCEVF